MEGEIRKCAFRCGPRLLHCSARIAAAHYLLCSGSRVGHTSALPIDIREWRRNMTMTKRFADAFRSWRAYRVTSNELMQLPEPRVMDIGIRRVDIPAIIRTSARF
jgi:uncharacterized protein YjiS (DUF1127 family)